MTDQEKYAAITKGIERRAPAMLAARALGVAPSIEEAFFLSALIEDETRQLGLPEHWYLGAMLKNIDAREAKTRPYKCAECGARYPTSDKRNACHPERPTEKSQS